MGSSEPTDRSGSRCTLFARGSTWRRNKLRTRRRAAGCKGRTWRRRDRTRAWWRGDMNRARWRGDMNRAWWRGDMSRAWWRGSRPCHRGAESTCGGPTSDWRKWPSSRHGCWGSPACRGSTVLTRWISVQPSAEFRNYKQTCIDFSIPWPPRYSNL